MRSLFLSAVWLMLSSAPTTAQEGPKKRGQALLPDSPLGALHNRASPLFLRQLCSVDQVMKALAPQTVALLRTAGLLVRELPADAEDTALEGAQ